MILTVTFNPAIDKTAEVDVLVPGGLNRLKNVRQDAGGKGINVSKTIKAFGKESCALGFLAGNAGQFIEQTMNGLHIEHDFVQVEGDTRTNLKVLDRDMELTELNEAGPFVRKEDIEKLIAKIKEKSEDSTYVVSSFCVRAMLDISCNRSPSAEKSRNFMSSAAIRFSTSSAASSPTARRLGRESCVTMLNRIVTVSALRVGS